jgi:hypothetical protein
MSWFKHTLLITTLAASLTAAKGAMAGPYHHHEFGQPQFSFSYNSGYLPITHGYHYGRSQGWHHRSHFAPLPIVAYHHSFPRYYSSQYYFQSALMTPDVYDVFEYGAPGSRVVLNRSVNNGAYSLTPGRVISTEGRYCREYQAKVMVNSRLQNGYGQACRQPDGSWEIIS